MKIVFRTDASFEIGSGHVVRCSTLAQELKRQGADVHFICRPLDSHLIDWLKDEEGFTVHALPAIPHKCSDHTHSDYQKWLGTDAEKDAKETCEIIAFLQNVDWLIVDHYSLDAVWEKTLRPHVQKIMVIDDLANRSHDCDVLLDQNFYHGLYSRYENLVPSTCELFLGPRFALLREAFLNTACFPETRRHEVKNILVFFGASDPEGLTLLTVKALQSLKLDPSIHIDIICGALNRHKNEILNLSQSLSNSNCHTDFVDMFMLMSKADLFISAGGTVNWEKCCFGLPSIVISAAENQTPIAQALADHGAHVFLGSYDNVTSEQISASVKLILDNPNLRYHMAQTNLFLVDGKGTKRIADAIMPTAVVLREAKLSDCDMIYPWRNHPDTRKYFRDPHELSIAEHREWFKNIMAHQNKIILVGESEGRPVGVVRIDLENDHAWLSIYVVPGLHNKGFGSKILRATALWTEKNQPQIQKLKAEIVTNNIESITAFTKAGYKSYSLIYEKGLKA